jgi:hypothetical protein
VPRQIFLRTAIVVALATLTGSGAAFALPPEEHEIDAGRRVAEAITLATGVPISPLLGISGFGAYRWWRTPPAERAQLAWYLRPPFWGTGLLLVLLFATNTAIGAAVPGLKKPMDLVEHSENQLSALLASPIVLIEIHHLVASFWPATSASAGSWSLAGAGLASVARLDGASRWIFEIGVDALSLVAFVAVFLAFHVVQVAIAFSPSAIFDALLRGFRFSVLAMTALTAWLNPYVGAAVGLCLLLFALATVGWAYRLMVFGTVSTLDLLGVTGRAPDRLHRPLFFAGPALAPAPVRSLGRLERRGESLTLFRWRSGLFLRVRELPLPARDELVVRQGLFLPLLVERSGSGWRKAGRFPPRYRGSEAALSAAFACGEVEPHPLARGFGSLIAWLRDLVGAER